MGPDDHPLAPIINGLAMLGIGALLYWGSNKMTFFKSPQPKPDAALNEAYAKLREAAAIEKAELKQMQIALTQCQSDIQAETAVTQQQLGALPSSTIIPMVSALPAKPSVSSMQELSLMLTSYPELSSGEHTPEDVYRCITERSEHHSKTKTAVETFVTSTQQTTHTSTTSEELTFTR